MFDELSSYGTTEPLYKAPTKSLRERVFERDNYTCRACGFHDSHGHCLQLDHAISKADGGSDSLDNLQVLCQYCNNVKGRISVKIDPVEPIDTSVDYATYMTLIHVNREVFYNRTLKKASNGFYRARADMYAKVHKGDYILTNTHITFNNVVCSNEEITLEIKNYSLSKDCDTKSDLLFTVASTGLQDGIFK